MCAAATRGAQSDVAPVSVQQRPRAVMPRGFLIKRFGLPGHDDALSAFHPLPFNPLHSLVERLRFDPRLCFYPEPYTPSPLDLSVKSTPITPPATPSPSSPPSRKRTFEDEQRTTPSKSSPPKKCWKSPTKKAVRKLSFDEDTTSPVSGTIIKRLDDDETLVVRKGDIDPAYNVVEVTEEAKAELAKIENRIGDYICRLCKEMYEDAFSLAQHRCSRIVHVEYRCPECDKVFNCPANLASHQRWHRPRGQPTAKAPAADPTDSTDTPHIPCPVCGKMFRRQAYLRKHLLSHPLPLVSQPAPQAQAL